MPEDPIAQSEIAALTRRYEDAAQKNDREFGIVKSDLTAVRLQVGNLDQKVGNLDDKVEGLATLVGHLDEKIDGLAARMDSFATEQRAVNATLTELLSSLVGRDPGRG
ncbi:hypothetical protein [Streptomyces sp. NPDC056987]|uniref:hypothetical protein n=1 Tax=Streptomyces sp. NPDC056987 TaxID=3345988 RepID=UPI003643C590